MPPPLSSLFFTFPFKIFTIMLEIFVICMYAASADLWHKASLVAHRRQIVSQFKAHSVTGSGSGHGSKVQTRFHICLGEHCGPPVVFRAVLRPPKGFCTIFNTQDGLSWVPDTIICGPSCSNGGEPPYMAYAPPSLCYSVRMRRERCCWYEKFSKWTR